eukprot:4719983-Amphidinium_carterae.1
MANTGGLSAGLSCMCPIAWRHVDLSLCGYADDLAHRLLVGEGTAQEAANSLRPSNAELGSALTPGGWKQNLSKEVAVPELRTTRQNRQAYAEIAESGVEVFAHARHLGG